ncbi:MAG: putative endonuclease [Clostridiales bacterium]|jgi:putative endonuclease|nr:putative endonuclease [Clostridiales bacterium]
MTNEDTKAFKNKRAVGSYGETLATNYLKEKGFVCLKRNFYTRYGEIDLICRKEETLYFVEVKYRRTLKYGSPREAVTPAKYKRMRLAAGQYLSQNNDSYQAVRFAFLGILERNGEEPVYDWLESIEF